MDREDSELGIVFVAILADYNVVESEAKVSEEFLRLIAERGIDEDGPGGEGCVSLVVKAGDYVDVGVDCTEDGLRESYVVGVERYEEKTVCVGSLDDGISVREQAFVDTYAVEVAEKVWLFLAVLMDEEPFFDDLFRCV